MNKDTDALSYLKTRLAQDWLYARAASCIVASTLTEETILVV